MAVPKRRQSKSRSAIRRAQVMKKPVPNFVPCPRCGEPKLHPPDVRGLRLLPRPPGDRAEGRGAGLRRRPSLPHAQRSPSTRWDPTPRLASRSRASWPPCARAGIDVILVGDEARLRAELKALGRRGRRASSVRHAPEVITMDDAPSMAVKQKKKSSMRVCFDLVKAGEADAVVSAGQLGRDDGLRPVRAGAAARRRAPGDRHHLPDARPASARCSTWAPTSIPSRRCWRSSRVLGSVYARLLHGKPRPKVGLLSNGSEEHKGTALTREAHQLLAARSPRATPTSATSATSRGATSSAARSTWSSPTASPATCVLKSVEGAAEAMLGMVEEEVMRSGLAGQARRRADDRRAQAAAQARIDYAEHGGAPLLGVDGVALICHGGSNATAIKNAVYVADRFAQIGLGKELPAAVARHALRLGGGAPPARAGRGGDLVIAQPHRRDRARASRPRC